MSYTIIINQLIVVLFIIIVTIGISVLFRYINKRYSKIRSDYILRRNYYRGELRGKLNRDQLNRDQLNPD